MIGYFGYGSNLDLTALKAKGVIPKASQVAALPGWRLRFNVGHFFRHEGGMGNIERTESPQDRVLGVLHICNEGDLAALDRAEAYGIGYDRVEVMVETRQGRAPALAYVGLPAYINDACLPTRRYLNILLRGATAAGLEPEYIDALRAVSVQEPPDLPPFLPFTARPPIDHHDLRPPLTVLYGSVFDMAGARPAHTIARGWFAGKEVTVFLLKRMDSSDGTEVLNDVVEDKLQSSQRAYLNVYLHAFAEEYDYVCPFNYASLPLEKRLG